MCPFVSLLPPINTHVVTTSASEQKGHMQTKSHIVLELISVICNQSNEVETRNDMLELPHRYGGQD